MKMKEIINIKEKKENKIIIFWIYYLLNKIFSYLYFIKQLKFKFNKLFLF